MSCYPVSQPPSGYEAAASTFCRLLEHLTDDTLAGADHAAAERFVHREGTEVMRQVYETWLRARAKGETVRDVEGSDHVRRTHHRPAPRQMESVFGTVTVVRDRVGAQGVSALAPVDAVLNLPDDRFSFGVRERVASEVVRGSFDSAVEAVGATTGAAVAKRQAEELVLSAAVDFDAYYQETTHKPVDAGGEPRLVVITADGKGIVMRPEGLRAATRAKAAKSRHKLASRLSKGEKRNRKRMATVAAVYDLAVSPRSAAEVIGDLTGTERTPRPKPTEKRVWASVAKEAGVVIEEAFAEAQQRDPEHIRRWVVLVDGSASQIAAIRRAAKVTKVNITLVLDFIHVTEYIWAAAWDLFKEGDTAAEGWVRKYLRQILDGRASTVAAAIRRAATCRKLEKRANIDKAATYLLGHVAMLRYHEFLRDGLPIATGVIEGACRYVVKDRMDITGARWGLRGAEAVLRLRSLHASGDLPQYWEFHRAREFDRNHASNYADGESHWLERAAA
jgi:hypothetical protein